MTPSQVNTPGPALLEVRGIRKSFPGVVALRGVDLDLRSGEVMAIVGENGAGKSTLIKILAGAHHADSGSIHLQGRPIQFAHPADARHAGIAVIHQELNLVPGLSARENIFLGRPVSRLGMVRGGLERERAFDLFERLGVAIDPETPCGRLTVAQRQIVEIAKALSLQAKILIMDEPTAALTASEVDRLFLVIRELQAHGLGIVYISHRLDEVFAIATRILVLRDGERVAGCRTSEAGRDQLIQWMVGRPIDREFPARQSSPGQIRFVARGLCRGSQVRNVSFFLRRGEVLGLTGLVGAGRTETARLIFGADRADSGSLELDGRPLHIREPADAIRAGIALLTEDRQRQGLVLAHSCRENFGLPNLWRFARAGFTRRRLECTLFDQHAAQLRIKLAHREQPARQLSGGNQQKLVLSKWLERDCELLLLDEPTRGIDVGAKYEFYLLINELARQGKAILLISSELPEVLGMSDRVLVMRQGRISGEIAQPARATQADLLKLAVP